MSIGPFPGRFQLVFAEHGNLVTLQHNFVNYFGFQTLPLLNFSMNPALNG